jgi:serine/threonine protein phosphatase PrpC
VSAAAGGVLLLSEEDRAERREFEVAGGLAIAYTCRSPDKPVANEDTVAALSLGDDAGILVVADGAGGMPAGRRASRRAVDVLLSTIEETHEDNLLNAVMAAISAANEAVMAMLTGSATTMTIFSIENQRVRAFQVGDSEGIVTGQRGRIRTVTTAHSPTGFAVEAGLLDAKAALYHPERHLVSNFIGMQEMRIDVGGEVQLNPFDTVLLASDGLTDNLFQDEIVETIRSGPMAAAMDHLVETAHGRMFDVESGFPGKPDDLSVILFRPERGAQIG